MVSVPDSLGIIVMSYFANGISMVTYHSKLNPIDQPAYVGKSVAQRIVAAGLWPLNAIANDDLAWILTSFAGTVAVFWLYDVVLGAWINSATLRMLFMGIVYVTPRVGNVLLNGPRGIGSAILWVLIVKPLGGRRPSSRPNLSKKRET